MRCQIEWLLIFGLLSRLSMIFGRITNLNRECIRCLCCVAGCDLRRGCKDGFCGPFQISKAYWLNADMPTLPLDDPDRSEAFEDCAKDYDCSVRIIENYIEQYEQDCNDDGEINCLDYMMINFHGSWFPGQSCTTPMFLSSTGLRWLTAFERCQWINEDFSVHIYRK